ncbi:hypothetical protein ACFQVA_41120 [Actinomadura keratinilytica]
MAGRLLGAVQQWLADDRTTGTHLAVVTAHAVSAPDLPEADGSPDLAGAALWGLIRSAQSENPGRFTLVDLGEATAVPDGGPGPAVPAALLTAAVTADEPQIAVRGKTAWAPRLVRADAPAARHSRPGRPTAPSSSPAAPAPSARWSPATWCTGTAYGTCSCSAAAAPRRPAPGNCGPN